MEISIILKMKKNAYVDVSFMAKDGAVVKQSDLQRKYACYIDSGASMHMCNDASLFNCIQKPEKERQVSVGNGKQAAVVGIGTVICSTVVRNEKRIIALKDVLCVPTLMCNLVSVSRERKVGGEVFFHTDRSGNGICEVSTGGNGTICMLGVEQKYVDLYRVVFNAVKPHRGTALFSAKKGIVNWHERLGHVAENTIRKSIPIVHGVSLDKRLHLPTCTS